jgi:hypothetical protein
LYSDYVFDEIVTGTNWGRNVSAGDVIFVKTDFLNDFFTLIHPMISHKYILLTHNSDYSIPHDPRMPGPKSKTPWRARKTHCHASASVMWRILQMISQCI